MLVKSLQTRDEQLQLDFRREAEMFGKLNHANVVRLLGLCREAEPHYMVLEYVDLVRERPSKRDLGRLRPLVAPKFGGVGLSCKTWGGFVHSLLLLLKLWDPCCRRAANGDCSYGGCGHGGGEGGILGHKWPPGSIRPACPDRSP